MSRPILFLFILVAITLFLLGIKIGNNVNKIDCQINQKINITPTVINTPTFAQLIYKKYELSLCKKTFTLSNLFEQKVFASDEARFNYNNQIILVSCNKQTVEKYQDIFATQESKLIKDINGLKTKIYQSPEGIGYLTKSENNQYVVFSFPASLLPLFL